MGGVNKRAFRVSSGKMFLDDDYLHNKEKYDLRLKESSWSSTSPIMKLRRYPKISIAEGADLSQEMVDRILQSVDLTEDDLSDDSED